MFYIELAGSKEDITLLNQAVDFKAANLNLAMQEIDIKWTCGSSSLIAYEENLVGFAVDSIPRKSWFNQLARKAKCHLDIRISEESEYDARIMYEYVNGKCVFERKSK